MLTSFVGDFMLTAERDTAAADTFNGVLYHKMPLVSRVIGNIGGGKKTHRGEIRGVSGDSGEKNGFGGERQKKKKEQRRKKAAVRSLYGRRTDGPASAASKKEKRRSGGGAAQRD